MAAADGDGPLPPELQAGMLMRWLHVRLGATFTEAANADYQSFSAMMKLWNVYEAVQELRQAKGDAIHHLPAGTQRIIASLLEAKLL